MAIEPDWFDVEEAACALYFHDRGEDVDLAVWEHEVPDVERGDYRREARRIAVVAEVLMKKFLARQQPG